MRDVILSIFGEYAPVMTDAYALDGTYLGEVVASGFAGVDWTYVAGVLLFAIVLWCFFRLLGGVLCRG